MALTKENFRKNCLQKLRNLPLHNKTYRDTRLNNRLLRHLLHAKKSKILFYYPLSSEADIRRSINTLRAKHEIYLPFMEGESFKMVPLRLPLKQKKFGIFEAGNSNRKIKNIDIAIVPVVGVDGNMQRIGFGKGMYDRFFAKLKKRPFTIFIQSDFCFTKHAVCDDYDVDCDLLITPKVELVNKRK